MREISKQHSTDPPRSGECQRGVLTIKLDSLVKKFRKLNSSNSCKYLFRVQNRWISINSIQTCKNSWSATGNANEIGGASCTALARVATPTQRRRCLPRWVPQIRRREEGEGVADGGWRWAGWNRQAFHYHPPMHPQSHSIGLDTLRLVHKDLPAALCARQILIKSHAIIMLRTSLEDLYICIFK